MKAFAAMSEVQWARILSSLDVSGPCWLWTKALDQRGYGQTTVGRLRDGTQTTGRVHQLVWRKLVGPVPVGLELDHMCKVKHCANPDHLEPVTHAENIKRHYGNRRQCPWGHEYTYGNSGYFPNGYRFCRTCNRKRGAAYRERCRQAALDKHADGDGS